MNQTSRILEEVEKAVCGKDRVLVWVLAVPSLRQEVGQQLSLGAQGYFLWKLMALTMPAAILSALLELVAGEIARRTESRLLRSGMNWRSPGLRICAAIRRK